MLAADVFQLLQAVVTGKVGAEPLDRLIVAVFCAEAALPVVSSQLIQLGNEGVVNSLCGHIEKSPYFQSHVQMGALHPLTKRTVSGAFPQEQRLAISGEPCCCVLFTVCLYACLSLLVPGQYAATWGKHALLQWSGGGHHAAELGCGRLRRCPVIRPATDR